jgi:hypothetical protein
MSAHRLPATCRCLWCPRTFTTETEAATHMHLMHRGNIRRSPEDEARAKLAHYDADRQAVERGGVVADDSLDTPRGAGKALAERLSDIPERAFLPELDTILDDMREALLAAGRVPSTVLQLCREVRQAARLERSRRAAV